jgi:predicted nucleic acid-binding protein
MWIVDSSVWIDYFGGQITPQTELLHAALGQQAIGVGDIILCEVLQGYRSQQDYDAARQALLQFPVYTMGGPEIALKSAEIVQEFPILSYTPSGRPLALYTSNVDSFDWKKEGKND